MENAFFDVINIALAVAVVSVAYGSLKGSSYRVRVAIMYIMLAAGVLGVAELVGLMQLVPEGSFLGNLVDEKEIVVFALLLLAVYSLKGTKQ